MNVRMIEYKANEVLSFRQRFYRIIKNHPLTNSINQNYL